MVTHLFLYVSLHKEAATGQASSARLDNVVKEVSVRRTCHTALFLGPL